jgi:hypothetical protein
MIGKTPKAWNSSQNSCQTQIRQNIYIKAQFESPKHYVKPILNLKIPATKLTSKLPI